MCDIIAPVSHCWYFVVRNVYQGPHTMADAQWAKNRITYWSTKQDCLSTHSSVGSFQSWRDIQLTQYGNRYDHIRCDPPHPLHDDDNEHRSIIRQIDDNNDEDEKKHCMSII